MLSKRKVQSTGGSSFFITLPKDWIVRNGINQKSEIDVFQTNNDALLLNKSDTVEDSETTICVDSISDQKLKRMIIGYYTSGVNKIILSTESFFSPEVRIGIRKLSSLLVGFEVFEEEANKISLKKTSDNNMSPEEYMNKSIKFIVSMYADILKTLENYDENLLKDIILRDDEIDRINLFLTRKCITSLESFGVYDPITTSLPDIYMYEHILIRLERVSDNIEQVAKVLLSIGRKNTKYIEEEFRLIDEAEWFLMQCQKMILAKSKKEAHILLDRFEGGFNLTFKDFESSITTPENVMIHYYLSRIVSYTANIAEVILNTMSLKS